MKNLILLLLGVLIVAGVYGYKKNPRGCQQLGLDLVNNAKAIYLTSDSTKVKQDQDQVPATSTSSAPPAPSPAAPRTSGVQPAPPLDFTAQNPPVGLAPGTLLTNGDFARGDSNWEGDGSVDPSVGRGLVVPLKSDSWTRISQDFKGNEGTVDTITIQFESSPDISPSMDRADYTGVQNKVQFEDYQYYANIQFSAGFFLFWVGDLTNHASRYETYPIKADVGKLVTIHHIFPGGAALADKMVVLAFPPGSGKVIIRSISVTSK